MLKNYIKILFRQLFKDKAYAMINIGGLAIGLSAVLLIMFYVRFESSFDKDLREADRLYRVNLTNYADGNLVESSARTSPAMGSTFKEELSAVEEFSRVVILGEVIAGHEEDFVREKDIFIVDRQYLDFFDVAVVLGHEAAMEDPLKVMISEEISQKVYGKENPVKRWI